jgi:hypothetical protein
VYIGSIPGITALTEAVEAFQKADRLMLSAVRAVNEGDILQAALSANEAELTAKSAAAVARKAVEVSGTLLDILA